MPGKLWFVLNLRDRGSKVWDNDVVRNPWIWGSLEEADWRRVYWPPLSAVLQTQALQLEGWLLILGMSLIPAILGTFAPGIHFITAGRNTNQR